MAEVAGNYTGFDYDYERQTRTVEPEKKSSVSSDPKEDKVATERDNGNSALAFQIPGTNNSSQPLNPNTKNSSDPNQAWGSFGSIRLPGGMVIPNPAALALGQVDPSTLEESKTLKNPTIVANVGIQGDNKSKDLSEVSQNLLDGQVDALVQGKDGSFKGNTFINYKNKDGQEYLAFKSDLNGSGDVRYGQRKIDENGKFSGDWENVTDKAIQNKLNKAHDSRIMDVESHGGIANYREAESLRRDLRELSDVDLSKNPDALGKLNGLSSQLDSLRDGDKIDPNKLRTDFNTLLDSNKDLKTAYLDNRISDLEKMNSGLDVAALKASVADTDKPISELKGIIDTAIDSHRDENQKIAGQDLEKLNGNMFDLEKNIAKLQNAGADPETIKSLTNAYNNLKALPNAQGKYGLEESTYLNSKVNSLINPAQQQPVDPGQSAPQQLGHEGHNHGPSPYSNPNFEQPEPQKPRGGGGHWHGGTYHEGSH